MKVLLALLLICLVAETLAGIVPNQGAINSRFEDHTSVQTMRSKLVREADGQDRFTDDEVAEAVTKFNEFYNEENEKAMKNAFRGNGVISSAVCVACQAAYRTLRWLEQFKAIQWTTVKVSQIYCRVMNIMDENICNKVILEYKSLFMFMIRNKKVNPKDACGVMHQYSGCPEPIYPTWEVQFDKPKPPVKPYPEVKDGDDRYYVLHMTDLHVDYDYTVGYEADCGEPICCRPPFNKKNPKRPAGQFGDYGCDAPKHLYLDMLQYVKDKFGDKLSFGVLTGDLPPHDIWQETRNHTISIEQWLADEFHNMLPNLKLYPAVGNHESVPVNEFVPRSLKDAEFDMGWLYDTLADKWAYWLPEDAVEMSRHAGYYTALSPEGVRIVSLNTNMGCNGQNWWLNIPSEESKDPENMLHWFADTMKAAEEAGEMVYLIYHISPDNGCLGSWFDNFFKIVYRYENNVLNMFAGHTHDDLYDVTFAEEGGKRRALYSTHYAGSMSPGGDENPTFRIYEVDKRTHAIVDYVQYRANITRANIEGHVTWEELYTAKTAYRMPDFSPESWHQASLLMLKEPDMNMFYFNMTSREADTVKNKCNAGCLKRKRCGTYKAPPGANKFCDE